MLENLTKKITPKHLGVVLMVAGSILLLHTLNILEKWLDSVVIIFSLTMIIYGAYLANLWGFLKSALQKKEQLPK